MSTRTQVFRSAWILSVGPRLAAAVALAVLIFKVNDSGLVSHRLGLWLYFVPILILAYAHLRWLLRGHIAVTRRQIVFRGWVRKRDEDGNTKWIHTRRMVPRSEWGSITVEGLIFPNVTWEKFGDSFVFERVGRPRRLCALLRSSEDTFDEGLSLGMLAVIALLFIGLAKTLKLLVETLKWSWPHLRATGSWVLRRARQGLRTTQRQLTVTADQALSPASEYSRFIAFCQNEVFAAGLLQARNRQAILYMEILEQAHILHRRVNGRVVWRLHPRIQSIEDITSRISQRTFEQARFRALLAEVDLDKITQSDKSPAMEAVN